MSKIKTGVYIHIPFCKKRCYYCDFVTFTNKDKEFLSYTEALIKEIRNSNLKNLQIETVFIGGGTPTVLPKEMLSDIIEEILKYDVVSTAEITVEANPGTLSEDYLKSLYNTGVNRLSIGLQAWQNEHLKNIGRIHTREEFLENYNMARNIGFKNINVDLIFGLPNLSKKEWLETLANIIKIRPEHISTYSLIIEEGTRFGSLYEKGLLKETDEIIDREMYSICKELLINNNYEHYEISNFSKIGYNSKHNIDCWKRKNYIGLGLNSHSFFEGIRYKNISNLEEYIKNSYNNYLIRENIEVLSIKESMEEFMFLGLRLIKGVSIKNFQKEFRRDIFTVYSKQINYLLKEKLLLLEKDSLYLSNKGIDLSNLVFEKFLL